MPDTGQLKSVNNFITPLESLNLEAVTIRGKCETTNEL